MGVSGGRFHAARLTPGADLIDGLRAAHGALGADALAVVTCVGSLTRAVLRHADRAVGTSYAGRFEILSLAGTTDPAHHHLHLSIADGDGRVFGGHLLPGSSVHTTAELVVVALDDLSFRRAPCPASGHAELVIEPRG